RDIANEVGLFYAGKKPNGQTIVVGLIQSLVIPPDVPALERNIEESEESFNKRFKKWELRVKANKTRRKNVKILLEYVKKAEMIIIDECDRAVSKQYTNIFKYYFRGRRRYGFSGTPIDPDK